MLYLDVVLQELTSQRVKNGKIRPGIKSGLSDVLDTTVREKTEVCQPDLSNLFIYTYGHFIVIICSVPGTTKTSDVSSL